MAAVKLTKALLENQPKQGTQTLIYDTALPGFGARISNKSVAFFVEGFVAGKRVRRTLDKKYPQITVDQAREIAKDWLYMMGKGIDPLTAKREAKARSTTLREVYERFKETGNLKPKTLDGYDRAFNKYLADWLPRAWHELTRDNVKVRHRVLAENSGPATANLTMRALRSVLNYAIEVYRDADDRPLIPENPVSVLSAKAKGHGWAQVKPRTGHLKPHEIAPWWAACTALNDDTARDWLLLILFTGLRRSEASGLRWGDVDFKGRTFTVLDTKNGSDHTLPMSQPVYDLLRSRKAKNGFVFPADNKRGQFYEPRGAIEKIEKATGLRVNPHDLRRTFATVAEQLDLSAYALKRLLNHHIRNTQDVTAGYLQIGVERLREPMQKIDDFILKAAGGESSADVIDLKKQGEGT